MPKINTLEDAYVEQLRDLYSAENQLIKALPKMAKAAHDPDLKKGFEEHLEQTKEHASRLEEIFEELDEKPTSKKCAAMAGLVEEGSETIGEDAAPAVKDAMLIAAAQRVEHYEIAAYGTVKTFAHVLGHEDAAKLLEETLQEEVDTDEKLSQAAESINVEANEGGDSEEETEEENGHASKARTATRRK
jgi:ferritin-like metal-binding protein YciE